VVESSPSLDQAAMKAGGDTGYAPAISYCRKVNGFYFFTADFNSATR
jgi:hypothetical protein